MTEKTARLTMEITNKQVLKIFDSSYDAMKIRIKHIIFIFLCRETKVSRSMFKSQNQKQLLTKNVNDY